MHARTSAPRVLWVTEEAPDRSLGGGSIRQAYLFRALAEAFEVDLLLAGELDDDEVREAAAQVIEVPKRRPFLPHDAVVRRMVELYVTLGSRYPLPAYAAGPARRELSRHVRRLHRGYDLVCVEHESLGPVIPRSRQGRWVITFHHLLSGMIAREVALAPGRRQRWFRQRDLEKARRMEVSAARAYDRSIVCSADDAAALVSGAEQGLADRVSVIPNGVDLDRFTVGPPVAQPRVLFPGTLSYSPNVDGAVWFCSEIWPLIRSRVPGAELVLAGRAPSAQVQELGGLPGVSVHPDVPSMLEYFDSARVVVVPLRVGTGTRLKALEAMAAGRPVVGTSEGLAGIGVNDGVQARVADDPTAFADAVVELLGDDGLAMSLGSAGRAHVEERFGWDRIGRRFAETVGELLNSREEAPAQIKARR